MFTSLSFSPHTLSHHANRILHQQLHWPSIDQKQIRVYLRRDDLASTHYPGNKWYKLFYHLEAIIREEHHTVVSFGGAYSNHIHALAALGKQQGINTVGIIRGHPPKILSPTLQDAQAWGMRLLFLGYSDYRNKNIHQFEAMLAEEYGRYYCLPEGGDTVLGAKGCQAIGRAIQEYATNKLGVDDYTVCVAVGTGTTFAGIVSSLPSRVRCLGFSALKGEDTISAVVTERLRELGASRDNWQVINDYHCGGYAKVTPGLLSFMTDLEAANHVLLEPVYSAKMLWGIDQLAQADFWPPGSTVVAVHGGGVQGRRGFPELCSAVKE